MDNVSRTLNWGAQGRRGRGVRNMTSWRVVEETGLMKPREAAWEHRAEFGVPPRHSEFI